MLRLKQIFLYALVMLLLTVCFSVVTLLLPIAGFDVVWSAGIFMLLVALWLHNRAFNSYFRAERKLLNYMLKAVPLFLSAWLVALVLFYRQQPADETAPLLLKSVGFTGFGFLAGLGMNGLMNWLVQRPGFLENERIMKQLELDHLKNQVNPHFLFNSLNNVAATIQVDPELALDYTYKLSAVLRYQIESADREYVTLGEEIQFLNSYLGIEKVRTGTRCELIFIADVPNPGEKIPPMLLQPLVEKAIRQSVCLLGKASVRISLSARQRHLLLEMSGSVPEKPANTQLKGIGMEYVQRRLAIFFPGAHVIEEQLKNGLNTLNLSIDLDGYKRIS